MKVSRFTGVFIRKQKTRKKKTKNEKKRKKEELKKKEMKKFDRQSLILRHPLKSSINDSILMVGEVVIYHR